MEDKEYLLSRVEELESKVNKLETRFNDFYRYVITIVTKKPWYKFW